MPPIRILRKRQFSLVEVVLVLALVVSLTALVVPGMTRSVIPDLEGQASRQLSAIGKGLTRYRRETGRNPCGFRGTPAYGWLHGPGRAPQFERLPEGDAGNLAWFLMENRMGGGRGWRGPYCDDLTADPWGRQYIVLCQALWPADGRMLHLPGVWVLSAGADGVIQTRPGDPVPVGDDLGIIVEVAPAATSYLSKER